MTGGRKCGAHGRQRGAPCEQPAGWGTNHVGEGRCKLHGGATLRGRAHPGYKHGLRSRYGDFDSPDVQAILERLEGDEMLASVEGEVRYLVARMMAWVEANRGAWSLEQLGAVSVILERLTSIKQRQQRLQIERHHLLEVAAVRAWLEHVRIVARSFIADELAREEFFRRIVEFALPGLRSSGRPLLAQKSAHRSPGGEQPPRLSQGSEPL